MAKSYRYNLKFALTESPIHIVLFSKGKEIFELTSEIVELISDEEEIQAIIKPIMLEDAAMLSIKVSGAEAADLYDMRMENAAIIRKAARDLGTHCTTLEMFGFRETQYLELIREAIEEYRLLFVEWVKGFNKWNAITDSWGLFNPPGLNPENDASNL